MGMGKTIQTIALLLSRRGPSGQPTMVVCPTVAMLQVSQAVSPVFAPLAAPLVPILYAESFFSRAQWKGELLARTQPDSLKVLVYHGSTRDREASELQKYDVILTTYATIEVRRAAICDMARLPRFFSRLYNAHCLNSNSHIVSQSEWRRQQSGFQRKGKKVFEPSVVHSIHYFRVILDEAHFIKDRSSSTARAMFGLQRTHGWLLSGTPLQNRVVRLDRVSRAGLGWWVGVERHGRHP
jgi:DNA repair protein RAD16